MSLHKFRAQLHHYFNTNRTPFEKCSTLNKTRFQIKHVNRDIEDYTSLFAWGDSRFYLMSTHSIFFTLRSTLDGMSDKKYCTMDNQRLVIALNASRKELFLKISMHSSSKILKIYHVCFMNLSKFISIAKSPQTS